MNFWTSLASGAGTALVVATFHSQAFRVEFHGANWLSAWLLTSLLWGGACGALGGLVTSRLPASKVPAPGALAGVLFGTAGYLLQVCLFLQYVFRNYPVEF